MSDEEEAESGPGGFVPVEALLPDEWTRVEPLSASERWEAFETVLWAYYLAPVRDDASSALYTLEEAVRDGRRPTVSEVREARRALGDAVDLVETQYAALASGVEPWDEGVGPNAPYGVLQRQLEAAGYRVKREER